MVSIAASSAVFTRPSAPGSFSGCGPSRKIAAVRPDILDLAPRCSLCESRALNTASIACAAFCVTMTSRRRAAQILHAGGEHGGGAEHAGRQHAQRDHRLDQRKSLVRK